MRIQTFSSWRSKRFSRFLIILIAFFLVSCGLAGNETQPPGSETHAVNGFGAADNHVHSFMALSPRVLLLATHYGLFRSQDEGANWEEVSGGKGQPMDGLMTYSLTSNVQKPQYLYVLAQPVVGQYTGTPGLYRSDDLGKTWKLTKSHASFDNHSLFLVAAGNQTADQVYVYLADEGAQGLQVSNDGGLHFSQAGTLPFENISGLLAIPGMPDHLLAYGSEGIALSTDGGARWQKVKRIEGGMNSVAASGPNNPIYASGDAGLYVSLSGGRDFQLVYTRYAFLQLATSPQEPQVVYGKIGVAYYRSSDAGRSWHALPPLSGNLGILTVDPVQASTVYLSLSYPAAIYDLAPGKTQWRSLTPSI